MRVHIVFAVLLLGASTAARAAWPPPAGATEAQLADPANWPNDPDYADAAHLHGFDDRGMRVDAAFATTRGDPRVVIALLSDGIRWDDPDLVNRLALNRGELPVPQDADGNEGPPSYDLNGDGRFNVLDYADDPRVSDANGNGILDPQDLLLIFGDQVDDDGNGLVDDICGWDFVDGDPDADADAENAASTSTLARLISAEANNGIGTVGTCPDCPLLPVRITKGANPAFPGRVARALRYASDHGARIVALPNPIAQRTAQLEGALDHAQAKGTFVVAAATPRSRWHEDLSPRLGVLLVARVGPGGDLTGCGAEPRWLDVRSSAPGCAAEAAATAAGVAGLVASAALQTHAEAPAPESLFQLLRAASASAPAPAQRLDAAAAVERATGANLPPAFTSLTPAPRSRHLPSQPVQVSATAADANTTLELHVARGRAPSDSHFIAITDGAFVPNEVPVTVLDSTFTLRARATRHGITSERRWHIVAPAVTEAFAHAPLANAATSPRLVDLDGDLNDELLLPGRDGRLHVLHGDLTPREGFPFDLGEDATLVAPVASASLALLAPRTLFVATLEGALHAVQSNGQLLYSVPIEGGMRAAPVVVDAATGPVLLAAALDGRLHAFGARTGAPMQGFPLQLPLAAIHHTPAAGDLDEDGMPEVVLTGTNASGEGLALVVHLRATGGEVRTGWPIPINATGSPVIARLGTQRDSTHLIFPVEGGPPALFTLDGQPGLALDGAASSDTPATEVALGTFFGTSVSLAAPLATQTAIWRLSTQWASDPRKAASASTFAGAWTPGTGAAVADVSGDGRPDLITGVGETLSAFTQDGATPLGFPVDLGAPLQGTATIGVQDGRLRLYALAEDGFVFPLFATGRPSEIQWDGAHHDPAHTGNFATPLPERALPGIGVTEPPELEEGCGCGATGTPAFALLLGFVALLLTRRTAP